MRARDLTGPPARRALLRAALSIAAAALLRAASPASAELSPHLDLASLAFRSDAIVLAHRTGEPRVGPAADRVAHRVLRSYAGALAPDAAVDVSYADCSLVPTFGWPGGKTPAISDDVVLFLIQGPTPAAFELAPSGLRIFADARVYRFEQITNPGPLDPVPQGRDPFDVFRDPRGGTEPIPRALFEADLAVALARAREAHAALGAPASPARTARLLDLVGPPADLDDDSPVADGFYGTFSDLVTDAAALALIADPTAFAEGVARARNGLDDSVLQRQPGPAKLLEVARTPGLPASTRAAALSTLHARGGFPAQQEPTFVPSVLALAESRDPEVRAEALSLPLGDPPPPGLAKTLEHLLARETDPRARFALVRRLLDLQVAPAGIQGVKLPVAYATRRHHLVRATWLDPGAQWAASDVEILATQEAHVRRQPLPPGGWSSSDSAGFSYQVFFDPPLGAGRWALTLAFTLRAGREERAESLALAPVVVPGVPGPAGEGGAGVVREAGHGAEPMPAARVPPQVRGCGCEAVAPRERSAPVGMVGVLAFLVAWRRRVRVAAQTG